VEATRLFTERGLTEPALLATSPQTPTIRTIPAVVAAQVVAAVGAAVVVVPLEAAVVAVAIQVTVAVFRARSHWSLTTCHRHQQGQVGPPKCHEIYFL